MSGTRRRHDRRRRRHNRTALYQLTPQERYFLRLVARRLGTSPRLLSLQIIRLVLTRLQV